MTKKFGKQKKMRGPKGKQGTKDERRMEELEDTELKMSRHNDPSWYTSSPQLLVDAASYPFAYPLGMRIDLSTDKLQAPYNQVIFKNLTVPGVMAIEFSPTIGVANTLRDPINVAAVNLYSFVRHVNSGRSNYEPADLMMYIVAVDSLYMLHAYMRRAYGVARLYTPLNRYYPKMLLEAMGLDPEDVLKNLAQWRYTINLFAQKLLSLRIPTNLSFITRHQWMCEGLYVDSTAQKAQTYIFTPTTYWQYDPTTETGTTLDAKPLPKANMNTLALIRNAFDEALNAVLTDEDVGIMSGDILKAFGEQSVLIAPQIPEDYMVLPVYSQEVLSQIENSVAVGDLVVAGANSSRITQNPAIGSGAIQSSYVFDKSSSSFTDQAWKNLYLNQKRLINMHHDGVSPAEVMVATRLSPTGIGDNTNGPVVHSCGTEIVNKYTIYTYDYPGGNAFARSFSNFLVTDAGSLENAKGMVDAFWTLSMWSQFDWAPMITQIMWMGSKDDTLPVGFLCDLDNFSILEDEDLRQMHEVAVLSEFDYSR